MDVKWGFHNLTLDKEASQVLTFTSTVGTFSYTRLPFGIRTATALFQRRINASLSEWMWREALAICDDMGVGTETTDQHIVVLTKILTRLATDGFTLKPSKVKFFAEEFEFLGHISTPTGLRPSEARVEAITKMPPPTSSSKDPKRSVRSFLGMASFL